MLPKAIRFSSHWWRALRWDHSFRRKYIYIYDILEIQQLFFFFILSLRRSSNSYLAFYFSASVVYKLFIMLTSGETLWVQEGTTKQCFSYVGVNFCCRQLQLSTPS